ncbi:MAG TPA: ABC transporter substrate-binding protein [Kiloniellaceae bacterium]|nr:ABC transporter substrate-binding protein [Kiloniellaceae bacterium]
MKRRNFLATAGVTAAMGSAAAASFPAPAIARGLREWRMVSRWPASFPDQYVAAERFARRIAAMSDEQLRITVLPPDALGDYKETLGRVRSGEVAMARSLSYDWRDGGWAFDVFTFVPLGMTEFERSVWLQNYGGQALWDGLYADLGVKPLLCGSVGPQAFGWFARPLESLEDLQGLRYRTTGITETIMRRLGAAPKVLPGSEIGTAVERGEIDAFELVGPAVDRAFGLHRYLPVYVFPSFHQTSGSIELIVNKALWDDLPSSLQEVVSVAAQAEQAANLADVHASNARALAELMEQDGVTLQTLPDDVLTALGEVTGAVLRETREAASPEHRRIFDHFLETRRSLMAWSGLTEAPFMAARSLPFRYL